jgi:ferrous-iron efflux pump FieF
MHLEFHHKAPLMGRAAKASVLVSGVLIVVKAIAWAMTGSVALLGSLMDSTLDLVASLVNYFAVKTAVEPPDADHRFGHGKAEAIAGLFQSSIIMGSAVFLTLESIGQLWAPNPVQRFDVGAGVSLFAIVVTAFLVAYQRKVVRETGSVAIEADSLHYQGDLLMNGAVIVALALSTYGGYAWADGLFGLLIALYIAKAATHIFKSSIDMLMDKEFSNEERENIFNIVLGNPDVKGLHDLKTRRSGLLCFIQMHIELDGDISLYDAHAIADEVEASVGEAFSSAEIIIHTDPLGLEGVSNPVGELD